MIKDNEIKFGYGDIAVNSSWLEGCVSFKEVEPLFGIGTRFTQEQFQDLKIKKEIKIYENEIWYIYDELKKVNKNNRIIYLTDAKTGKKYILNFENYNEKSLEVVKEQAFNTVNLLCLAC